MSALGGRSENQHIQSIEPFLPQAVALVSKTQSHRDPIASIFTNRQAAQYIHTRFDRSTTEHAVLNASIIHFRAIHSTHIHIHLKPVSSTNRQIFCFL